MKKRLITSFLALATTMSFNWSVIADDAGSYAREIDIMSSVGLFEKISADDAEAAVTRAEFAAAVTDLLDINVSPDGKRWFLDVDEKTTYYNNVSVAAQSGIIHGTDGYFYPDRQITYLEAATMLVNALGYKDYAFYEGSYSAGYLKMADSTGIKKNITASTDTPVNAGMAARLLFNAGNANIVYPTISGDEVKVEKGDTLFWEKHRIADGKGILNANCYTTLETSKGLAEHRVQIGDSEYNLYYNNAETKLLGYNVEYYYVQEDGENNLLWIAPLDKKNEVEVVTENKINGFDKESMTLSYEYNNKNKKEVIYPETAVIYNGKLTIDYFINDAGVEKSVFDIENGEIKLIDNDGDNRVDVVSIQSYENYVVASVNTLEKKIYDMYDAEKIIDFEEYDDPGKSWIVTDKNGKVVDFEKIPEKAVLSVAVSADQTLLRGVVSEEKIQGVLSGVKTVDEETVIVFGSAEYVVCDSYLEKKTIPSVASNVVVFLDYEGRAAGISVEAATSGYAFVLKSYVDEAMNEPYVRLFTQDGTKTDCGFAKKITIDGEVYTKGTAGFSEYIKSFGDYKLIKYKINADNEIKFMDTVEEGKGTADDSLRCLYNMPSQPVSYFDQVSYFSEGKLAINSDTIIIEIPPVENKTNYDAYKLSSVSGFGVKYYVAGYTSDPDGFVAEVLLKQSSGGATDFTGNGPCLLIEEIVDTIDEDDHAVKVLKGWRSSDNKQVEITIAADCTFKNVSGTEALDSVEDLRVGEIIMYTTDADGRISYFEVMKRMNRDGLIGDYDNGGKYASWPSDAGFACSWGYLIARDETMIGLVKTKAQLSGITNPDVIYNITTNTSIYHVSDDSKTKITPISRDNLGVLTDYKHNYQTTEVICIGGNTHVKMLVVY